MSNLEPQTIVLDKYHMRGVDMRSKNNPNKSQLKILKNILILAVIMSLCTFSSILFKDINVFESNIIMIYLLGVLLYSFFTGGYIYSIMASICGVILYNFFFTEPYYTLQVSNPDYIITFIIMFIVGFFTSMLTIKVKYESQMVIEREERIAALYEIGKSLLEISSVKQLAKTTAINLSKYFSSDTIVKINDSRGEFRFTEIVGEISFNSAIDEEAILETYQSGSPCGYGTNLFSEAQGYYSPIVSQNGVLGVIGIALINHQFISEDKKAFIEAIATQVAVVLERERLYEKQQEVQLQIREERLKADMLRSISHDLRTPLTGIMGLSSTALSNYNKLDDNIIKEFLITIYSDADWLNELVENILQATRFEEGKVKLNIEQEAAEEIITEAVTHINKRLTNHKISVKLPEEIILLNVDGILIRQVLINLLNNSLNYCPEGSEIIVTTFLEDNNVYFEVSDDGPGISQAELPHLFERNYNGNNKNPNHRKGAGIGLSLCKSIVEAHDGKITIMNRKPHGTTARFYIPLKG